MQIDNLSSHKALFRLIYLLSLAFALFFIQSPAALGSIFIFQLILWKTSGLKWSPLARPLKRLSLFFLIIFLSYAFLSTATPDTDKWLDLGLFSINLSGVILAGIMCLRVTSLIIISLWVQNVSEKGEFVGSLRQIGIPAFLSVAIDASLALLAPDKAKSGGGAGGGSGNGSGGGSDHGRHRDKKKGALTIVFKQILRGDLSFLHDMIAKAFTRSENYITKHYPDISAQDARDIAIISGMTLAMMGLKLIQLMPGLPIAPGHKNLLMLPMFLLASQLTYCRFGGLWTGLTMGVVNFLFGFGKFGVLEILQFAVPGLLADIFLPLAVNARSRLIRVGMYGMIGAILGIGRFSANLGVLVLAGTPMVAVIALMPMLFSQVIFGTLSGIVSAYILGKNFSSAKEYSSPVENENQIRKSES